MFALIDPTQKKLFKKKADRWDSYNLQVVKGNWLFYKLIYKTCGSKQFDVIGPCLELIIRVYSYTYFEWIIRKYTCQPLKNAVGGKILNRIKRNLFPLSLNRHHEFKLSMRRCFRWKWWILLIDKVVWGHFINEPQTIKNRLQKGTKLKQGKGLPPTFWLILDYFEILIRE